jgi:O-antigen/teichoic acid export membrane protein
VIPSRWRPSFRFDTRLARPLLSYGANIAAIFVLGVLLLNVDYLLVGRYLGAAALGVYTLAFRVPELLIKQFYGELGNVLFPIYTQMRHDVAALRQSFLTTMRYVTLVTVPLGLGLALVAKPLVLTIFGDKWVDAIPVMSAIAIYMMIRSVYDNSGSVYKAQGHPDLLSKLNLLHLTITAPALWCAIVQYGTLTAVAWTQVLVVLLVGSFRLIAAARMVNTPLGVIFSTLRPVIFGGTIMSLSVFAVLQLTVDTLPVIQLGITVTTGILTYCLVMWWLQRDMVLVAGHKLRAALTGR